MTRMFRKTKKIKELEKRINELENLCMQLSTNSLMLTKEFGLMAEAIKILLEKQQLIDAIIDSRYNVVRIDDDTIN